jgi:hypothetical protein
MKNEVHICCKIKKKHNKQNYQHWLLNVDMDCLTKSKPFELEGNLYYIVSFKKKMREHLNIIMAYDCKVITQSEWRDRQLKNILN